jgi:hypothetical protein
MQEFKKFPSIPRFRRDIIITEKIDGTNASVHISDDGEILAGSRTRFVTPEDDNHGFAKYVEGNKSEFLKLGAGVHYGEWWGPGINRGYGRREKVFSLFNVIRWRKPGIVLPACCELVPVLYEGIMAVCPIDDCLQWLHEMGSKVSPGFMRPEGIVIYHIAANQMFKITLEDDEIPKSKKQISYA